MNTDLQIPTSLPLGGIAPNTIRELSGIYPTFVSAFKELVSNAYDADATFVKVQFSPDLSTVTIEDNGIGMTPTEFQNEYLRIGGSARHQTDSTAGGRRPTTPAPAGRPPPGGGGRGRRPGVRPVVGSDHAPYMA